MILVLLALLCVASVPLSGGRLSALADLELRGTALVVTALAVQVVVVSVAPGGSHALHAALHVGSYVLAAAVLVLNRRLPGVPLIAAGAALNVAAILANGGVMPASADAMRIAGVPGDEAFANSAAIARPHLLPLGDVIPVPGPWPLGNVLSVGDLVLFAGGLVLLHRTARGRA